MSLGNVSNLETTDMVVAIPVEGPEVEYVLDVFHAVDMAVDVDIILVGVDGADELGVVGHFYTAALVDRARLILNNPVVDGTIVDGKDIGGLARLGVNHCPDGATISILVTVGTNNSKVTGSEVAHGALDPRLDIELGVLLWHLSHLDGQSREHPRTVDAHKVLHAETTR